MTHGAYGWAALYSYFSCCFKFPFSPSLKNKRNEIHLKVLFSNKRKKFNRYQDHWRWCNTIQSVEIILFICFTFFIHPFRKLFCFVLWSSPDFWLLPFLLYMYNIFYLRFSAKYLASYFSFALQWGCLRLLYIAIRTERNPKIKANSYLPFSFCNSPPPPSPSSPLLASFTLCRYCCCL